jgi:hypothetical protein
VASSILRRLPARHHYSGHARVAHDHEQRFNFFPASPFCYVTWVIAGDWDLIKNADEVERP